ncbi:MAG: hypothetical protein M3Z66_00030 [Chloroflexota bacterium]|nr:hypothetical protein [Chloroflexota bacterium]
MHGSFSSAIASWQSFYMLSGTASATLIGLLFVAVSLHINLLGESGVSTILSLARRTFTRFILVVVVALLFLVPHQDPKGLGLPLLAFGLVDVLRAIRVARLVIFTPERLPLVSSIGLILVAATLLTGTTEYLYWMVPIIGVMLTNAATNAWDLMLGLAKYKGRRAGDDDPSDVAVSGEECKDEWLAHTT